MELSRMRELIRYSPDGGGGGDKVESDKKELRKAIKQFQLKEKRTSAGKPLARVLEKMSKAEEGYIECPYCGVLNKIGSFCVACSAPLRLDKFRKLEVKEIAEKLTDLDGFVRRDEEFWGKMFLSESVDDVDKLGEEELEARYQKLTGFLIIAEGRESEVLEEVRQVHGLSEWSNINIKREAVKEMWKEANDKYMNLLVGDSKKAKIGMWEMKAKRGYPIDVNDEDLLMMSVGVAFERGWELGGDLNMYLADRIGEMVGAVEKEEVVVGEKKEVAEDGKVVMEELPEDRDKLISLFRGRMVDTLKIGRDKKLDFDTVAEKIGLVVAETSRQFIPSFPNEHIDLREKLLAELKARLDIQNAYLDRRMVYGDYTKRTELMKNSNWSHIVLDDYRTIADWERLSGKSKRLLEKMEEAMKIYVECGEKKRGEWANELNIDDSNFFAMSDIGAGAVDGIRERVRNEIGGDKLSEDAENLAWQFIHASDVPDYFNREGYGYHLSRLTNFSRWRADQAISRSKEIGVMRLLVVKRRQGVPSEDLTDVFDREIPRLARVSWDFINVTKDGRNFSGLDLAREGRFFRGMNWDKLGYSPNEKADDGIVMGSVVLEVLTKIRESVPKEFMSPGYWAVLSGKLFALMGKGVLSLEEVKRAKMEIAKDIFWEWSLRNPEKAKIKNPDGENAWISSKMLETMFNALKGSNNGITPYFTREELGEFEKSYKKSLLEPTKKMERKYKVIDGFVDGLFGWVSSWFK